MSMNRILLHGLLAVVLIYKVISVPPNTEVPIEDEDDEWDEDDESSEIDDDGRVYKNPRNSPSTECPRDEEQATLLGQKCLRKCSSDEDCKSKKKKCLCDGVCGMSCIKPDRECPELAQPSLGQVTIAGKHFGARASYSCPHGYHVVGLQSRLCQADGNWAGAEPACKQNIYCLKPPQIEHARHSALPEQETFDLDSTVQYHCHNGYVTNGFPRAKCLAIDGQAAWYGPDIQCEPRSCGQPPDPSYGWHAGECYTYGCKITYNCGSGYELVGKHERFCQSDGSWTPKELPTCVLVTSVICTTPENPKNGKATYTTLAYNSVVSYECRYGYTLVGESSSRCGADRKWSGTLPICKEINCGHPGVLYNGWIENIEAGTGLGASIIFRCHSEMLIRGYSSSVCQIDGRWRNQVPECLAPCVVPTISQGYVIPIEIIADENSTTTNVTPTITTASAALSVEKVKHGTALDVKCEENYEFPVSLLSPPTCNNGTWSIIPRCVPARCKNMPKSPKHGMVLAPKSDHGMKARFKCKDGFKLISPDGRDVTDPNEYVLTCSFGNWTGETPLCTEVYCSFPGYIPNGKVLLVGNMGLYDYRPYVKKIVNNKQIMYDCDKGYVLETGPPGATCVGGKWRPLDLPQCLLGQHPRLRWNRKRRSTQMRYLRSIYLLRNKRLLKRQIDEYSKNVLQQNRTEQNSQIDKKENFNSRVKRNLSDLEKAYSKYYQIIKQKYQNYVKNLLGYNQLIAGNNFGTTTKKIQAQDGRWYSSHNPDLLTRFKATHKSRTLVNDFSSLDDDLDYFQNRYPNTKTAKILMPNINENSKYNSQRSNTDGNILHSANKSYNYPLNDFKRLNAIQNITNLIEHLKSQIIRRRRKRNSVPQDDDIVDKLDFKEGRKRLRGPCEDLEWDSFSNVTVVRSGKVSGRNSVGSILQLECNAGFKLNIKNENSTAKCIRGVWKPETPKCQSGGLRISHINAQSLINETDELRYIFEGSGVDIVCVSETWFNADMPNTLFTLDGFRIFRADRHGHAGGVVTYVRYNVISPCLVPAVDHGKYYKVEPHTKMLTDTPSLTPLSTYEEIQSNEFITLECEEGHNIQGSAQLRCAHGSWSVNAFSECISIPCTLPELTEVTYEGGYRAGLTIAHGSSVNVHCNHPTNTLPIQINCNKGTLKPSTIHCESGLRKSREEYVAETEINKLERNHIISPTHLPTLDLEYVNNTTEDSMTDEAKMCGPPTILDGALVYKNVNSDNEGAYDSGTEIYFNCIPSIAGERNTWKIICENGEWIGRSYNCANGTCIFKNNEPHVVSFYNDLEIREDTVEFPPGATIISRCTDIGKYAMVGSSERICIHSEWTGNKPSCFGLNQENDYAMEKAPTILFRHQNGPISQSNDGKLIVYPGTTLHMECLWMRRFGNPKWNVSHEFRNYPEGWVTDADEGRDATLEYRLSIIYAVEDDSGIYTCQTPARHEHSVEVVVKSISCPEIPIRRGLIVSTNNTNLSSRVLLSCANGNSLIGASELFCLPSGNWSAPLPVCESVECGDIPLLNNLSSPRVAVLSREVGGRAAFSCSSGYGLRGPSEAICLPSGEWATPFPTCMEVQCDSPGAPQNGYAQGSTPYRAGDVVQFNCNPEYMMQGQPIIACQDNGRWSGGLPKCVQACSYPGTAISGRMSSVKFYYAIGESITFTCDAGLELRGAKMLKCLRNGKWSSAIPTCISSDQVNKIANVG